MSNLLDLIVENLDSNKANDITVMDFRNENPICDYFVVCDGSSLRQINALADNLAEVLAENNYPVRTIERETESSWILLDAYDVIVHIFFSDDRNHYNLEKLYRDYVKEIVL